MALATAKVIFEGDGEEENKKRSNGSQVASGWFTNDGSVLQSDEAHRSTSLAFLHSIDPIIKISVSCFTMYYPLSLAFYLPPPFESLYAWYCPD